LATVVALASLCPAAGAQGTAPSFTGYLTMSDGVKLRYSVAVPADPGPHPVLLNYAGYESGTWPDGSLPWDAKTFTDRGYAIVGVNARGTGCSGGSFATLTGRKWADDAYRIVEWIAKQPWATPKVGMIGGSFPGVTQWTAARKPSPHLAALVPLSTLADSYRDSAMPGGIPEPGFYELWAEILNETSLAAVAGAGDDAQCAANVASRGGVEPRPQVVSGQLAHPYDDKYWKRKTAADKVRGLRIPTLVGQAWQDEAVGSRVMTDIARMVDPRNLWVYATNGGHDGPICNTCTATILKFYDRYLKDKRNGWERTPHTTLMFDSIHGGGVPLGPATPAWTLTDPRWPPRTEQVTLNLHNNGRMDQSAVTNGGTPPTYKYPRTSPSVYGLYAPGTEVATWQQPADPNGRVAYTTPPLTRDAIVFGASSANLWLSSTATDTDVQVTLTEVRPDGQETYLTRGWLRASHRALDPARSTAVQPYHSHLQKDAKPLTPGQPALLRVDIRPFAHAIRKGSSLRLIVDAPTGATGTWTFDYLKQQATNTIRSDPEFPSSLTIAVLKGRKAAKPLPADCNRVMSEVCRPDAIGVPGGALKLRPDAPRCTSRRVVHVTVPRQRGERLLSASVRIGSRKARVFSARQLRHRRTLRIDLRRLRPGRHRVIVRAKVRARGRTIVRSIRRTYRTCPK
jgi:uncharacterized protein